MTFQLGTIRIRGMKVQCKECGAKVVSDGARGRTKRYCSDRCRKRASRRRLQPFPSGMMKRDTWARADDKRPIQVNGRAASSTDPRTWAQFDDVKDGPGDGYGIFMGQGLGVIDIDHCLTDSGLIKAWARDVLRGIKEPVVFVRKIRKFRKIRTRPPGSRPASVNEWATGPWSVTRGIALWLLPASAAT